ncbi:MULTISPECIES: helix-turn-helix transcriptional regulator [Streptomyces]|uniref:LuxR family transcriptional regulator n=1 Tax=Streptomyces ramulosus TaxID=47762 RepID=A0ABW1FEB5_9ACTN
MNGQAVFPSLQERADDLAVLHQLLTHDRPGPARFAFLSGPTGCGKSELLRTFARQVTHGGGTYLGATASRTEHLVPFGVWAQLFRGAAALLPGDGGERPLPDGAQLCAAGGADGSLPLSAQVVNSLCLPLLDAVERLPGPVVLGIDDFQHADAVSLQCLAAVVRRLGTKPVLIVLGEAPDRPSAPAALQAELPLEPHSRRLRLRPLSRPAVRDLLTDHLGAAAAERLFDACYDITAGNPLQLHGLIADNRRADPADGTPAVDSGYTAAVLSCLHRCGDEAQALARYIALLDDPPSTRVLTQLAGVDTTALMRTVNTLTNAGVLSGSRFRHAKARAAVLDNTAPAERAALRGRVAEVLYRGGAAPVTIARQLLGASPVPDGDWAAEILDEAARTALRGGEPDLAHDCLVRARELEPSDEKLRAAITATLFDIEWRTDPCAAVRGLPALAPAPGGPDGADEGAPATVPLWLDDVESAVADLQRINAAPEVYAPGAAAHVQASLQWLRLGYPTATGRWETVDVPEGPAPATPFTDPLSPEVQGAVLLSRLSGTGPDTELADEAERLLRRYRLTERSFAVLLSALITLLYSDRLESADAACRRLAAEAQRIPAQNWQALFTAARAELALRRGALAESIQLAHTALSTTSQDSWGVGIGMPLGTLIKAGIASGQLEIARRALRVPVPDTLFETPIGLHYLCARGRHHLASGQPRAALDEFTAIGALMTEWEMDVPALVAWRSEAAWACLALGDRERARTLARAQLERCTALQTRARGEALRALAACGPAEQRPAHLKAAAAAFTECGALRDRAAVLRELDGIEQRKEELRTLGERHTVTGRQEVRPKEAEAAPRGRSATAPDRRGTPRPGQAAPPRRTAAAARTPRQQPFVPAARSPHGARPEGESLLRANLSDAEGRVAELAARGHSNRQIAARLYITVSTVEQHLTRVYRKLHIKRRTDLTAMLRPRPAPLAHAANGHAPQGQDAATR